MPLEYTNACVERSPAVNDVPPPRASSVLTSEEQMKVEDELTAARNRAASAAGSKSKPAGSTGDQ